MLETGWGHVTFYLTQKESILINKKVTGDLKKAPSLCPHLPELGRNLQI